MTFVLIKGTFHVEGYSLDGDSIRFRADDPVNWKKLSGPPVALNALGHAHIRMEAVDALETNFQGFHQPLRLARPAVRYLLTSLGIHEVVWDETKSRVIKAECGKNGADGKDGIKGYILARSTESLRRPVAFVFAGESEEKDGSEINLNESILTKSLNYGLIVRGLAYPMYYSGLFSDLRLPLTYASVRAREEERGIWPYDLTTKGFSMANLGTITNEVAILPKLFRRIVGYMGEGGSIDGFVDHLRNGCDPMVKVAQVQFTRFDSIVEVKGDRVKLTESPENLIFLDRVLC